MNNNNWRQIKLSSTTEVALNYFVMRKRMKKDWATADDFYRLIPNRIRRQTDVPTILRRMVRSGYLQSQINSGITHYAITKFGSEIPIKLASMHKKNSYFPTKDTEYNDEY